MDKEPLIDFDAMNHAIKFYATQGHRSPAHAAIHFMFGYARSGGELPPQPDDFTRGWVACQREAVKVCDDLSSKHNHYGKQMEAEGKIMLAGDDLVRAHAYLKASTAISSLPPPASAREG